MTVSGRIRFESSELEPPANLSALRVSLPAVATGSGISLGTSPAPVTATGAFTFNGVTPGRDRLLSTVPPGVPKATKWALKSAVVDGRDVLDSLLEIQPGQHVSFAVVTFTDRPTEITGALQDAQDAPASDYFIIVFAADPRFWPPPSRRVQSVRPGARRQVHGPQSAAWRLPAWP